MDLVNEPVSQMLTDNSFHLCLRSMQTDDECLDFVQTLGIYTLQSLSSESVSSKGLFPILASKGFLKSTSFILQQILDANPGFDNLELITPLYWEWGEDTTNEASCYHQFDMLKDLVFRWNCSFNTYCMQQVFLFCKDWTLVESLLRRFQSRKTVFDETSEWSKLAEGAASSGHVQAFTFVVDRMTGRSLCVSKWLLAAISGKKEEMVKHLLHTYLNNDHTPNVHSCKMLEEACLLSCAIKNVEITSVLYQRLYTWILSDPAQLLSLQKNMMIFTVMYQNVSVLRWAKETNQFQIKGDLIKSLSQNQLILHPNLEIYSLLQELVDPKDVDEETLAGLFVDVHLKRIQEYWRFWFLQGYKDASESNTKTSWYQTRYARILKHASEMIGLCLEEPNADYSCMSKLLKEFRMYFPVDEIGSVLLHAIENQAPKAFVNLLLQEMEAFITEEEKDQNQQKEVKRRRSKKTIEWLDLIKEAMYISLQRVPRQFENWLLLYRFLKKERKKERISSHAVV